MIEKEIVLNLGHEGGGATLYRTPLASGGWVFHVERSGMDLDENDVEVWRYGTGTSYQTIEEALRSRGDWFLCSWDHNERQWHHLCLEEPEKGTSRRVPKPPR